MPNLSVRIDRPELMDTTTFEMPVVRRTLDFLGMTARYFGGAAIITDRLAAWAPSWPANADITILDVGTGGAEIPISIAEWARRTGRRVRITALDLMPDIADVARTNAKDYSEIDVLCRDVFALQASGSTYDYVTASLFLHHIPTPRIGEILRLFDSMARRGVIVSDLARTGASYWAVTALAMMTGNHVVRHDAPLSVQRSFTAGELQSFADGANLRYLKSRREPWFRLSLAGEKA